MAHRYDKIDPVMLYQQQKSHYDHLYNPRSTYKIVTPERKTTSLYYKNKTTSQRDRQRKIQNKKMLVSLLDIYNGNGLLIKMEEESKNKDNSVRRSLFMMHKKEQQIKKQNRLLRRSLEKVEPSIGNKQEWRKHYQQHLQLQKKLASIGGTQPDMHQYVASFHSKKQKSDLDPQQQAAKDTLPAVVAPLREKRKRKLTKNKLKHIKQQYNKQIYQVQQNEEK